MNQIIIGKNTTDLQIHGHRQKPEELPISMQFFATSVLIVSISPSASHAGLETDTSIWGAAGGRRQIMWIWMQVLRISAPSSRCNL